MRQYFDQLDGYEASDVYNMVMGEIEKPMIEVVLEECGQNQSKAAQLLGLSRSTLRKKLAEYDIRTSGWEASRLRNMAKLALRAKLIRP